MKRLKGQINVIFMFLLVTGMIMNANVTAANYNKSPILIGHLSGNQQAHNVETDAQGKVTFHLSDDGEELYYQLSITNINSITAAHIHMAPKGKNGRVVVVLFDFDNPWKSTINSTVVEGTITSDNLVGPLVGSPLSALIREMEEGNAYINVHSKEHPQGNVRGQIIDPSSLPD
jgi:hypothetical protein